MAREVIGELVSVVKIDATQAAKESAEHARRLRGLKEAQDNVTKADKEATKAATALRKELLEVRKQEVAGTGDKKALAKQAKEVRLRLQEQAEGAKALRLQQRELAAEQRDLQKAMRDTARVAAASAREQVAAAKLIANAEAQAHRERMNFRRLQQSGARINELTDSISASDVRLMRLRQPLGGLRVRAGDALQNFRENWRDRAGAAVSGGLRAAPGAALGAGRALAGAAFGVGGAVVGAGAGIAAKGADFESLRASLETVEGSAAKAGQAFKQIQQFASQTPYTVEQTTRALLVLKAQGLDASLPALTAYGDTASAMGKSLDDMVQAVADAATGEFERLKEFGIKAKSQGDQVQFTFRGVSTTVAKESSAIEKYLIGIGKTNFAGGMVRQSKTLQGQLSTLGDAVANLADVAFQNGLGDALKDVVADMSGAAGGADDLAKSIGQVLGDAVRGAYQTVKDLVGPVDELPAKFKSAADFAGSLARGLGSLIKFGADVAGVLGPTGVAITGIGIAATAALGPLGALLGVGVGIGAAFAAARDSLTGYNLAQQELAAKRHFELQALQEERTRAEAARDEVLNRNATAEERNARGATAEAKFRAARLRALGKTEDQLTKAERAKLENQASRVFFESRDNAGPISRSMQQGRASAADLISSEESAADRAEFARLSAERRKGKLSKSKQKRLSELADALDVPTPAGKGKKAKEDLSAFEEERKREIDNLVKQAELDAADRALARGDASGAAAASRAAGKAARERLTAQAATGALPGEVERSLLRQAGFEDAKNTPPPPLIAYFQTFNVELEVPVTAEVHVGGSADDVAEDIGQIIQTKIERDIVPKVHESFRSAIRR